MATRHDAGLRRGVGLRALASILFINLAMAVFVSLGVVADEALGLTPVVFVIAGSVFLLTLLGYVEGIAAMPQAGGAAGFAREGLGELASFFTGWALILDYLILVVLTAYFGVHYLGAIPGLGFLLESPVDVIVSACMIVAAAALTMGGVRAGARTRVWVALAALGAQLALAVVGLLVLTRPHLLFVDVDLGTTPTWAGVLFALPIAMIGFTGLDSVANLGAELDKPGRDIPRPLAWSAVTSVFVFVVMSVVALGAQPVTGSGPSATTPLGTEAGWVDRPIIGVLDGLDVASSVDAVLRVGLALLAALVLLLAASSALSGLGRVAWFMSRNRQAPSVLFSIDRNRGVPRRAILLLSFVAIGLLLVTVSVSDSAVVLVQVYAFGATLTATFAGLALVRLRATQPDLERPYRAPGNVRLRGHDVSIAMVLGLVASFAMWCLVLATHDAARAVGITWMVVGFVGYATYRLTHGLPVLRLVDPREQPAVRVDMRSYRKVLIAVRPEHGLLAGAGDAELLALADKLVDEVAVDEPRPQVAVMLVHELALVDPLDAPLGDVELATTRRLAAIRDVATRLDLRLSSTITRSRAAGRAICQEAGRREADAVLLATRMKRRQADAVFGRTVTYVLRHAPCDVVVLALPEESLRRTREDTARVAGEE